MLQTKIPFFNIDITDKKAMEEMFKLNKFTGLIHLAGKKSVPESVDNPISYYENNVYGSMNLIDLAQKYGVSKFIFSSSASVYGDKIKYCSEKETSICPVSPYASTKLTIEEILNYTCNSKLNKTLRGVSLRYFNPVGAHHSGLIGDFSNLTQFSNLFKVIESISVGLKEKLDIYGKDYYTVDGTPVRDYVHVEDIAEGHVMMLSYFDKNKDFKHDIFNMGTEKGHSVKEVIDCYNKSNNISLPYEFKERRQGDVESITADCSKIKEAIGWESNKNLEIMCEDSYRWAKSLNKKI